MTFKVSHIAFIYPFSTPGFSLANPFFLCLRRDPVVLGMWFAW